MGGTGALGIGIRSELGTVELMLAILELGVDTRLLLAALKRMYIGMKLKPDMGMGLQFGIGTQPGLDTGTGPEYESLIYGPFERAWHKLDTLKARVRNKQDVFKVSVWPKHNFHEARR